MTMDNRHKISITGIVVKDGKYLITKRSADEKLFPSMWTVPGGKLEVEDYIYLKKDTSQHWYNIFEKIIRKEVKEEVGLDIKNIRYLTNMIMMAGETPLLIVSLFADYDRGEVVLDQDSVDYAWVDLEEAEDYDLIEGIYDELIMLDKLLNRGQVNEWKKEE